MKTYFVTLLLCFIAGVVKSQDDKLREIVKEGIDLHDKQNYRAALAKYRQALNFDPGSPLVYYEIAYSYAAMKMYDSVIWYADKVIDEGDEDLALQGIILKGSAIDDEGNTQEAVEYYHRALNKHPDHYLLLYNYAVSCERLGMMDETENALGRALRSRISHPSSNLKLAYLQANKGEKVRAIMGLYFFLLLENNSHRSAEALNVLIRALYGNVGIDSVTTDELGNKTVEINLVVDAENDLRMTSAEIAILAITSASPELNKGKTFEERFVTDTERIFDMLGEMMNDRGMKSKKKSGKKEHAAIADVLWDVYLPYFYSLKQAGHTEAFCYHLLSASTEERLRALADSNKEKLEYFYLWANTN